MFAELHPILDYALYNVFLVHYFQFFKKLLVIICDFLILFRCLILFVSLVESVDFYHFFDVDAGDFSHENSVVDVLEPSIVWRIIALRIFIKYLHLLVLQVSSGILKNFLHSLISVELFGLDNESKVLSVVEGYQLEHDFVRNTEVVQSTVQVLTQIGPNKILIRRISSGLNEITVPSDKAHPLNVLSE